MQHSIPLESQKQIVMELDKRGVLIESIVCFLIKLSNGSLSVIYELNPNVHKTEVISQNFVSTRISERPSKRISPKSSKAPEKELLLIRKIISILGFDPWEVIGRNLEEEYEIRQKIKALKQKDKSVPSGNKTRK